MRNRMLILGVLAVAVAACGESTSESSFTSCVDVRNECTDGVCTIRTVCDVEECESEIDYEFDGEEYESKCTFGETITTITYPLDGGPGRQEIRRDLDECFYEAEFDGGDFEEEGRCTRVRDCTLETLDCDESDPGDPDCRVEDSQPCPAWGGRDAWSRSIRSA